MSGFFAFTKKEFTEHLRSYKSVILVAVLFLFGMMSPLLAKMLPDIMSGMKMQGLTLSIPPTSALDAYGQFFKNIGQMGLVILLLIFSGLLSQDITKGTLIVLLAKGLPRHTVILSKFISALTLWTVGYALAAVTAYGYTVYLFGNTVVLNLFYALFCLWFFGVFVIALLLLASTVAQGNYGGLLLTAGVLIVLLILNSFPAVQKWNPVSLAANNTSLLSSQTDAHGMAITVWVSLGLIAAFLISAVSIFNKKRL
jgi:ABC-2 type transport system permease protein